MQKPKTEECQEMATERSAEQFMNMCQVAEETEVAAKEFDTVRSKF